MSCSFPKSARLRLRREFQKVSSQGKNISAQYIQAKILKTSEGVRIGITVTKKYGKAHDRNRFKRYIRESFRLIRTRVTVPIDINVRPQAKARQASFNEIRNDIAAILAPFITPPSPA